MLPHAIIEGNIKGPCLISREIEVEKEVGEVFHCALFLMANFQLNWQLQ